MTSGGYILLIIVSVCVLALIYIAIKQKELANLDDYVKSKEKEKEESRVKKKEDKKETIIDEKVVTHPQHVIYTYSVKGIKRHCPFCDGENSVGARVCSICGRDQ